MSSTTPEYIDSLEDAYRRIILDLLRTRTPSRHTLQLTAGELERLWWPRAHKKQLRLSRKRAFLFLRDDLIDYFADRYRKQGERKPRTRAEQDAAAEFGLSVAGLRRKRGRYRRSVKA